MNKMGWYNIMATDKKVIQEVRKKYWDKKKKEENKDGKYSINKKTTD